MVLAEDTRTSGVLLQHFDIKNRLMSHHKFNEHGTTASVVDRLKAGETIALISDAGTPGISDPGFFLAREAAKAGITVQCLPGATFGSALRSLLLRGFPAAEEGQTNASAVAADRDTHDDILRVALSLGEDARAVC